MPAGDPLADEIVHLYGLPPEEFVAARNAVAKASRQEGRRDDATTIAALRKPSVVESAVNRTARCDPQTTARWAAATRAADAAQSASIGGADATDLRAAVKELRAATEALVDATVTTVDDAAKRDDVAALLRSVPVGAVDQVVNGVLGSADRTETDLFAGAPTPPPRPAHERPETKTRTTRTSAPRTPAPESTAPTTPPQPPKPSRRERTLAAAVERREAALADAVARHAAARTEADAARDRLATAERDQAAAESTLAAARRELREEQGERGA